METKNPLKRKIYSSIEVYHKNGKLMFYANERRANWYINKNLAEKISDTKIILNFDPKGWGDDGNPMKIENKCVICGVGEELTKHHVIPTMYRKLFPDDYKSKSSQDVLPVCRHCHELYERHADKLKEQLAEKYIKDTITSKILKSARIFTRGIEIYPDSLKESEEILIEYFGKLPTKQNLLELDDNSNYPYYQNLVIREWDLIKFSKLWRRHFVEFTDPKFLPKGWQINMQVGRRKTIE